MLGLKTKVGWILSLLQPQREDSDSLLSVHGYIIIQNLGGKIDNESFSLMLPKLILSVAWDMLIVCLLVLYSLE